MNKLKLIKKTGYFALIAFLVIVAALVVMNKFGIGGIKTLIVSSGSMEPAISKSSVVLTVPTDSYSKGDVVTFKQSGRENVLVTHRVESIEATAGSTQYITKGDANEEADGERVLARNIVGEVVFSVPYIGSLISFAQTQVGFIALIVVPAVAIIYSEILSIKNQIAHLFAARKSRRIMRPLR